METASLQLFSDWNEYFSTEVKLARKEVDTAQVSLFGTDFGEMIIQTPSGGQMFIGSDEFRHANALTNDVDSIKLKGNFFLGDHTIMVGYEREMLDIFNLFVPRSQGQWTFASIDDFEDQVAASLSYGNAFTNDAADGAATFGYDVDSFYVQDEWQATPDLKFQAGVRMDMFSGDDEPLLNTNFAGRYGFNNQADARRPRPDHAAHRLQLAVDARKRRSTAAGACSAAARRTSGSRTASRTTA